MIDHNDRPSKPLRICILTPGQLGSNPRVVKEADCLHAAGHAVTVLSTKVLDVVEERDQAVLQHAHWTSKRIDLRGKLQWRVRRAVQMLGDEVFARTGFGPAAVVGHSPMTLALTRAALLIPADLYIAHYPAALPAAARAAQQQNARYAFDAEDFHPGDWPEAQAYARQRTLVRRIESDYLPGCASITAASPGIAEAYRDTYALPLPQVVLNAFPLAQTPPGPTPRGNHIPGPSVYWFSQTIGANRGLEAAVRAIAAAQTHPHLHLRGTPAANYADEILGLAHTLGVADRVHLLPPAAPDAMERLAAAYDLGLCGEPGHTRNNNLALSNKLFSYLLAGVPPVLSGTRAHQRFAKDAGMEDLVYPIDDHVALAAIFDRLLGDPARLAQARASAWRLGQERYNWDQESKVLLQFIEHLPGLS